MTSSRETFGQRMREKGEANRLPIGFRQGYVEVIGRAESSFYTYPPTGETFEKRRAKCKCHYCGNEFVTGEEHIKYWGLACCPNCKQTQADTKLKSKRAMKNSQTGIRGITPHPKGYQVSKSYKGMRIHLFSPTRESALILREELQEEMEQYAKRYEHLKAEGCGEMALKRFAEVSRDAIRERFGVMTALRSDNNELV